MTYEWKLKEFLDQELGDYSWNYEIELTGEYKENEYYTVKVYDKWDNWEIHNIWKWNVDFRVWEKTIEVALCEDNYEEVEYFDWTVKYFWMALLMK